MKYLQRRPKLKLQRPKSILGYRWLGIRRLSSRHFNSLSGFLSFALLSILLVHLFISFDPRTELSIQQYQLLGKAPSLCLLPRRMQNSSNRCRSTDTFLSNGSWQYNSSLPLYPPVDYQHWPYLPPAHSTLSWPYKIGCILGLVSSKLAFSKASDVNF